MRALIEIEVILPDCCLSCLCLLCSVLTEVPLPMYNKDSYRKKRCFSMPLEVFSDWVSSRLAMMVIEATVHFNFIARVQFISKLLIYVMITYPLQYIWELRNIYHHHPESKKRKIFRGKLWLHPPLR